MKKHIVYSLVIALACIFSTGCGQNSGSASSTASDSEDKDMRSFKLADGTGFNGWVSSDNHADKRSWIWCDAQTGPVSYRINTGDWKPMSKIAVSEDEKLTITQDPNGKFGAAETLPQGSYAVGFKVGTQEFSGVKLVVE